ncbi:Fic/DOC family protein [Avibacterium paragallinarum]|uniref:protein adenylyltransferase n=1 Tax=Avibacterium paragallinarum TaxID=728 RepID=A0ABU7QSX4_AVIPA|nr:Fic family protein [Avibacterium paragallinarum]
MNYAEFDHYSDKNNVLKNKLGIDSKEQLEKVERLRVAANIIELKMNPIVGNFDLEHLKKIHKKLFGDIYEWAGEIRDVNMSKGGVPFANYDRIEAEFDKLHTKYISKENYSANHDKEYVAEKLSYYLGEINVMHPFREGNGRVQREFISLMANKFGYNLEFNNISQKEMIDASMASRVNVDNSLFEKLISDRLTPINNELDKSNISYQVEFKFNKILSEGLGQKSYDVLVNGVRADELLKKDNQLSKALEGLAMHKDMQQKGITAEALKSGVIQPKQLDNELKVNRPETRTINAAGSKIEPKSQELQSKKTNGFSL